MFPFTTLLPFLSYPHLLVFTPPRIHTSSSPRVFTPISAPNPLPLPARSKKHLPPFNLPFSYPHHATHPTTSQRHLHSHLHTRTFATPLSSPLQVCKASAPWSPQSHFMFPTAARQRAVSLLLIGYQLAGSPRFKGEATGVTDVWVAHVMPCLVVRG